MLISRRFFCFFAPIIYDQQNESKGPSGVIGARYYNWREKREFARLAGLVTGVTEHAGVARMSNMRKFGANLVFLEGLATVVSGHAGVSTFRIGAKFGHLEAECPGLWAEEGIPTCKNLQICKFWAREFQGI